MTDTPAAAGQRRIIVIAIVMSVLSALVYCTGLEISPIYVTKDEASYAIQSHAIATTGRDTNGRWMPLFFEEPGFGIGRDPIYIYASALVLRVRPMTPGALRVPTTLAAVVAVGLTVLIAYELFGSTAIAVIAGVLLTVTPVFFIRSRAALSVILPVPFQLAWLLCLLRYSKDGRLRQTVTGTIALGAGLYSYLSMLFFAPIHLAFSVAESARQRQWRHAVIIIAVFAVLLVPLLLWQFSHPGHVNELASSYRVYPAGLTPLQGVKDVLSWSSLSRRSDIYWSAFNPSRLFFSGESSLIDSTREAGLYPVVYLALLPLGVYAFVKSKVTIAKWAILIVFILGPVPGALVGEETIGRYLIVAPLAAVLAAGAIAWLWQTRMLIMRAAAIVAVAMSIVLFSAFYRDYMGDWRARSAMYFGGNLRGAMEYVLSGSAESAPDVVYLSERIPYVNVYWEFYRRAHNRADLLSRDRGLRITDADWRESNTRAAAIVPGGDDPAAAVMQSAGWTVTSEIREYYGGPPTYYVLERK